MENCHCFSNCKGCPASPRSVFNEISQQSSQSLAENKVVIHYKKGQTLFHQGTPAFGIYCIGSGKVKLSKVNEAGGETIYLIASEGELIGYQDYLLHPEYLTTATVLENCTACFISNEYLHSFLLNQPSVAIHLLNQRTEAMEMASSYGHASLYMSAKNRVASLLFALGTSFGVEKDGKVKIDLRLTRHEMASMIGTASETMIRSLSELKGQGILEQQGNFIFINDMKKLHDLSNSSH